VKKLKEKYCRQKAKISLFFALFQTTLFVSLPLLLLHDDDVNAAADDDEHPKMLFFGVVG
jgi:hypothetical protein|tara:strand:+ start:172 stop:351 length:180 start_codon:yes stop_codon:yes gene_type:complete